MTFSLPSEKLSARDHRSLATIIAEGAIQHEADSRARLANLCDEYQALVARIREIEPRQKIPAFPDGDTDGIEMSELLKRITAAQALIGEMNVLLERVTEERETRRRAALSPIELLREEFAAQFAALTMRVAQLEGADAQLTRRPDAAFLRRKEPPPPFVTAIAERSGPLTAFAAEPARSGVRRLGEAK